MPFFLPERERRRDENEVRRNETPRRKKKTQSISFPDGWAHNNLSRRQLFEASSNDGHLRSCPYSNGHKRATEAFDLPSAYYLWHGTRMFFLITRRESSCIFARYAENINARFRSFRGIWSSDSHTSTSFSRELFTFRLHVANIKL